MDKAQDLQSNFIVELRRGMLVLVILSRLNKPAYGYQLVKDLAQSEVPVEANTIYPLLRRLEEQGILRSDWTINADKPRKIYALTEEGARMFAELKAYWYRFSASVNRILEEGER